MLETILSVAFLASLTGFTGWGKYQKHQHEHHFPQKYWEGKNPNERTISVEELRLTQRRCI